MAVVFVPRFVTPYGKRSASKQGIWCTFVVDLTDSSDRFREDVVIFCRTLTLPITPVAAPKLLSTFPILSLIADRAHGSFPPFVIWVQQSNSWFGIPIRRIELRMIHPIDFTRVCVVWFLVVWIVALFMSLSIGPQCCGLCSIRGHLGRFMNIKK